MRTAERSSRSRFWILASLSASLGFCCAVQCRKVTTAQFFSIISLCGSFCGLSHDEAEQEAGWMWRDSEV